MSSSSILDRSPVYGGSSNYRNTGSGNRSNMDGGQPKLSRLQQMQMQYQQKMMRDKEEKLINMYQETQERALNRVQSKGMAREFFRERREMEANGNLAHMPSITQHYQQKRQQNGGYNNYNKPPNPNGTLSRHNSFGSNNSQKQSYGNQMRYQKHSAGRDKSHPLAPIEHTNTQDNDIFPRKPQIHGRPRTKDSSTQDKRPTFEDTMPKSAPVNGFSPVDNSPPPNLTRLKNAQKQKMNSYGGRPPKAPASSTKQSDFQKWQSERDQERTDRLKKRGIGGDYEYEDEEMESETNTQREMAVDIERQQREIMEKIAQQQAQLEKIRRERTQQEEEERKERERRKKREEERRRKMKENEEKRRKEEQERRKIEEEEMKKRVMNEQRTANHSRSTNPQHESQMRDYASEGYASNMSSYRADPTPPPQPKPSRKPINRKPPQTFNPPPVSSRSSHDDQALPSARNNGTSFFEQAAKMEGAFGSVKLVKCSNCGRKFDSERINKHKASCGNLTKKRKVMDPAKMRVAGTDMEKYVDRNGVPKRQPPQAKKGNWRAKHEEFINSIKYARKVTQHQKEGGDLRDLPPPPPSENPDYVQCPHCSRKFNPTAAERHIPRCKDIKAKPAPLKRR